MDFCGNRECALGQFNHVLALVLTKALGLFNEHKAGKPGGGVGLTAVCFRGAGGAQSEKRESHRGLSQRGGPRPAPR